jgi:hypothetical protein
VLEPQERKSASGHSAVLVRNQAIGRQTRAAAEVYADTKESKIVAKCERGNTHSACLLVGCHIVGAATAAVAAV